jgi:hypothetical protein
MNNESFIQLERLLYDEDDVWHVVLTASNGSTTASQEVYLDKQQVEDYATALLDFPRSRDDAVELEIGRLESKWAHYVLVRAFLVDSVGHSAIWVVTSITVKIRGTVCILNSASQRSSRRK